MLGYHVSKNGRKLPEAVKIEIESMQAAGIAKPCCQVFFSGPMSYKLTVTPKEALELKDYELFVHGAYVDYMNGTKKSTDNIKAELLLCDIANANGLVLHLGANMQPKSPLEIATDGTKTPIYLEINAQKPPNWSEPATLYDLFEDMSETDCYDRLGLCIDTQHLYSCGVPLRTANDFLKWKNSLVDTFTDGGLELPPLMFHINDSDPKRDLFGTGVDRHAEICEGTIWKGYTRDTFQSSGCAAVLNFCQEHNLPGILESKEPERTIKNLQAVGALPF